MGKIKQQSINSRTEFFYYAFRNILLVSIPLLLIFALILSLPHSSADGSDSSGTDSFTVSISSACTISSVVNSEHSIETNVGTYVADVGKTTITTLCNDGNGYNIYANGYSNNEEGNNKLINTSYPQYSIDTGLATSGLTSAWAMKLNNIPDDPSPTPPVIESNYDDTYGLVPNVWTKVAGRQSGTTDMSQGSSFTTTYSIYASSSQFTGTYEGQVKYALLHPYKNDSIMTFDDSFALHGKNKVLIEGTTDEYYAMQDMTTDICNSVTRTGIETTTQLVDTRDNNLYWVAKLADDKCWMTQNLDLDINGTNTVALTSENTDISTDPNIYASSGIYSDYTVNNGVYTWNAANTATTSGRAITYPSSGNPTVSNWVNNDKTPYSAEGGDTYYYTSGNNNGDTRYTSLQACKDAGHTETECGRYFAGNYYNWTASVASNNSTNISANNDKATNSICPKGWRLPNDSTTDNEYNEFGKLLYYGYSITTAASNGTNSVKYKTAADFVRMRSDPLYFVRSGGIYGGILYSSGVYGYYWPSTVASGSGAYGLSFNSTDVWPSDGGGRVNGWSVRCVAR